MHADSCYTITHDQAIALHILSTNSWQQNLTELTAFEHNCLNSQQFNGALADLAIVNDSTGKVYAIYIGSGVSCDDIAIMHAINKLIPGTYSPATALSHKAQLAWSLSQYRFDKYKLRSDLPKILVVAKQDLSAIITDANAIFLARDLINMPANDLGTTELAQVLKELALSHKAEFSQWVGDELIHANFPAIYAVGRAGATPPRLLSLSWGDKTHPHIVLIGKGVCFDSGGLDLKPSAGMRLMKKDMGGAAIVIALAQWLMTHKLPIFLEVLIPAVENSIAANAYRPGDILVMRNGLKVEIHNTDAEGRLILADALAKASESTPQLIIDFATLTGAARVALGTDIAAMFSNHDNTAHAIEDLARQINDPIWRLPLFAAYETLYSSTIADCANASDSPYAGAISAALFLQRFITSNIPWVHFDVMAWNTNNRPGKPEGGEAHALMAIAHYLYNKYATI